MSSVDVSVVIPCYNSARTLGRALMSVANQTRPPREVIVVNDGSNDNVREVVDTALQVGPPFQILLVERPVNDGAAVARNRGWEIATSHYVAFLDADDEWLPHKLERQYDVMQRHPEAVLSGHLFTHSDTPFHQPLEAPTPKKVSLERLLFRNVFSTPSAMIRRDVATRFRAEWTHSEDYLLWMETVARHGHALLIREPLVRLHKAAYGEAGLSANTHAMQQGQIRAFLHLRSTGVISRPCLLVALTWSYIKYVRRRMVLLTGFR